jgi:hypothetical protein
MNDSTQVIDSLSTAAAKVAEQVTSLGSVLQEIAPLLYFIGAIIILSAAFFIWDAKK